MGILDSFGISLSDFEEYINENKSVASHVIGACAEINSLRTLTSKGLKDLGKPNDHDRTKPFDRKFEYRSVSFMFENKSVQTNSVKNLGDDLWSGDVQVDGSDKSERELPSGKIIKCTNLVAGGFDILAANCFPFGSRVRWQYAMNCDLSRSTDPKFGDDAIYLLASSQKVFWPPRYPFTTDVFLLLDRIIADPNVKAKEPVRDAVYMIGNKVVHTSSIFDL